MHDVSGYQLSLPHHLLYRLPPRLPAWPVEETIISKVLFAFSENCKKISVEGSLQSKIFPESVAVRRSNRPCWQLNTGRHCYDEVTLGLSRKQQFMSTIEYDLNNIIDSEYVIRYLVK